MSAKWMGYFFDDTELEGSKLLLALAVADHADADGRAHPGMKLLEKKIRKKARYTRALLAELVAEGYVEIIDGGRGRGRRSYFQLKQKGHCGASFTDEEKRRCSAGSESPKSGAVEAEKEAPQQQEKRRHSDTLYKDEPFEPDREPCDTHTHGFNPFPTTVGTARGNGRPVIQPRYPAEVDVWLGAAAPLFGAKSVQQIFHLDKWRETVATLIRDGNDLAEFLSAVQACFLEHKERGQMMYFGPNAVLKQMQLSAAAAVVPSRGGIDPYSGRPWGER